MNVFERFFINCKGRLSKTREIMSAEDGIGTVEVILILVVLIGLIIIFKDQIQELVETIFASITEKAGEVTD